MGSIVSSSAARAQPQGAAAAAAAVDTEQQPARRCSPLSPATAHGTRHASALAATTRGGLPASSPHGAPSHLRPRRVTFCMGPLPPHGNSADGHPLHEGETAVRMADSDSDSRGCRINERDVQVGG